MDYCYSSAQLYGVNPRSPLEGQPAIQQALGSALCVTKKNNAYMVSLALTPPCLLQRKSEQWSVRLLCVCVCVG